MLSQILEYFFAVCALSYVLKLRFVEHLRNQEEQGESLSIAQGPHTRTPCNNGLLQFSHSKAQLCFPRVGELVQRKRLLCWAVGIEQRIAPKPAHVYFPSTGKLLLDLDRLFFHIPQTCPEWLSSFMLVWQLEEIILFFFITLQISFKWAHRHS